MFRKIISILVLLVLLAVLLIYFGRETAPTKHTFHPPSGEEMIGTVVGKTDGDLFVETSGEGSRRRIEISSLGWKDKIFAVRLKERVPPAIRLPVRRTLTNQEGKSFSGTILNSDGEKIHVARDGDEQQFVVDVSTLSDADRDFVAEIRTDGSATLATIESQLDNRNATNGRTAVWHRDIANAKREARATGLPIVLIFQWSQGEVSNEFDRTITRSKAFREWANENAVLCLYYNNPARQGTNTGLNGIGSAEGRELADRYGVSGSPGTVILDSHGNRIGRLNGYRPQSPEAFISKIEGRLKK